MIAMTKTVSGALDEVTRWHAEEAARLDGEVSETDQEIQSLRAAIANLESQLDALTRFRGDIVTRRGGLGHELTARSYTALFSALAEQARALDARAAEVVVAEQARQDAVEESLRTGELAQVYEEYVQFKLSIEPTLSLMPEGYRKVLLAHHQTNAEQVQAAIAAATPGPVQLTSDPLLLDVVFAVDAPEGPPEVALIVLPVSDNASPLASALTARVTTAMQKAVAEAGRAEIKLVRGSHRGMLALESEVVGARAVLPQLLASALQAALSNAAELRAARVEGQAYRVEADYLLPPDTET